MPILTNSNRSVLKATYVNLKAPVASTSGNSSTGSSSTQAAPQASSSGVATDSRASGNAMAKTIFARNLRLQIGEVDHARSTADVAGTSGVSDAAWQALKQFEPQPLPILTAKASTLVAIASDQLLAAGRAILAARTQRLQTTLSGPGVAASGVIKSAVASAAGAINAFEMQVHATPVGLLHLERLEMVPAGIQRGELVATIPLAPGETTSVEQKEWSVTSEEFASIVTDSLENYSEKGVTEKTDMAQSTESQTKHSQQTGLNASVSGSYGFVTFSTSANLAVSSEDDESKKDSRDHATEVTQKASSRVRQEHKVTIQTSSVSGTSETSTRTLTNPSSTDTMRIDYFSMMRKWRVQLLRYGVRMTYDLAIPEPGATLRALHARLADLNAQINTPFTFDLDPNSIQRNTYQTLAKQYTLALPPPPNLTWTGMFKCEPLQKSGDNEGAQAQSIDISVPDGFQIHDIAVGGSVSPSDTNLMVTIIFGTSEMHIMKSLKIEKTSETGILHDVTGHLDIGDPGPGKPEHDFINNAPTEVHFPSLVGLMGSVSIPFISSYAGTGLLYAKVTASPALNTLLAWQQSVWQAIYNTARDAYYTQIQALTQQRDALQAEIENVDTLTLRREEREEIMKCVLRWLLGPEFEFMPKDVQDLFSLQGPNQNVQDPFGLQGLNQNVLQFVEGMSEWFVNDDTNLSPTDWSVMYNYGEMVKFIMEAIEWENLLYILYPYFWDIPFAWDYVRRLQHPDPTREEFLRAGSARVVLTIRPGWEDDFLGFLENGEFGKQNHSYMTITDEIRASANTNYPGIPPANPETSVRPLLTPLQRKAWKDMQSLMGMLDKYYNDNNQTYPTTAQGLAALATYGAIPSADPWGKPYVYTSPGQFNDYDLSSLGADGVADADGECDDITSWATASLIGEWYEYTPSHGLDIAVASKLDDMG